MRIKKINYKNFRNFKDKGSVEFSDGDKVTIIYGVNGTGKTTFHQLMQWILYGTVNFNASSNNNIFYNHEYENEVGYNKEFNVYGEIEFEHDHEEYVLRRSYKYYKDTLETRKIGEEFVLTKRNPDNNWDKIDNPEKIIAMILPEGLKNYFFFDGERMIADLGKKGKDSAAQLKSAMYSILGLNIYENAIKHLGNIEAKTTVLGKLNIEKLKLGDSGDAQKLASDISILSTEIEKCEKYIKAREEQYANNSERIEELSEQIGATGKSNEQYEKERAQIKKSAEVQESIYKEKMLNFGQQLEDDFSEAIISSTIDRAKAFIKIKTDEDLLPDGLTLPLINHVLKSGKCIFCDEPLTEKAKAILEDYKLRVPPHSYKSIYNTYCQKLSELPIDAIEGELVGTMVAILKAKGEEEKCYEQIAQLDEAKKRDSSIQNLISERITLSDANKKINDDLITANAKLKIANAKRQKLQKDYDDATVGDKQIQEIEYRMHIAEEIINRYNKRISDSCSNYSKNLEKDIRELLEAMLTSKRSVTVTKEFMLKVFDGWDDEAKSEGQFAVVSFAYIGGILKLINEATELNGKTYPLVLDGPFSKLDEEQRDNVIKTIPNYAHQVVILSKDDITEYFDKDKIGKIYSIYSNDEKNVSQLIPGYSKDYFETNGWRL